MSKPLLKLADFGYLLEAGRIVGQGEAQDLREDPNVKKAFLGAQKKNTKGRSNA